MKTILFLDVNGVLDCLHCGRGADCGHYQRLRRIVDALQCGIVLTSSVRTHPESCVRLRERFAEHRIPEWIGATPDLCGSRWTEIMGWVEKHVREETRLVIIDDGSDADPRPHAPALTNCHFFRTSIASGLDDDVADAVIALASAHRWRGDAAPARTTGPITPPARRRQRRAPRATGGDARRRGEGSDAPG